MTTARNSSVLRLITLLITICLLSFSAYAGYSGGTGEPYDPYQIATVEDLLLIGSDPDLLDKHYILVADIDLDPNAPGGQVFSLALIAPDTSYPFRGFTGSFDGNNHLIHNLVIDGSGDLGIFGFIDSGGQVKNLRIENILIKGQKYNVGGLAGRNWGIITNCHITGSVYGGSDVGGLVGKNGSKTAIRSGADAPTADDDSSDEYVEGTIINCSADVDVAGGGTRYGYSIGGLTGGNSGGIISCCRSGGMVTGERWVGGLVGGNSGWIENCYSYSNVQGEDYVGGLIGRNTSNIMLCYCTGAVTGEKHIGGLVGSSERSTYLCYWDVQTSGISSSNGGRGKTTEQMKDIRSFRGWGYESRWIIDQGNDYPRLVWEQSPGTQIVDVPCGYDGGTGDVNDPYRICTAEQFLAIGYCWPDFDKHFVLVDDIDLSEIDPNLTVPIGIFGIPFSGSYDGNNLTISSFIRCWRAGENYVGAFGYVGPQGIIRNTVMFDADIRGNGYVGALAGSSEGSVLNCFVIGSITGDRFVGGLVGYNKPDAIISLCSSISDVAGSTFVGGLVGQNWDATISMCDSTSAVAASDESAGGLVGMNLGEISYCYSHGQVSGHWGVGGLVGINCVGMSPHSSINYIGDVFDSYSTATIDGYTRVGGLTGENWGIISRCYSSGEVIGVQETGGLIGYRYLIDDRYPATAEDCYWDTSTSDQETSSGGEGKTTTQMMKQATFVNWDFFEVWDLAENQTYPFLRWSVGKDISGNYKVDFNDFVLMTAHWYDDNTRQE